VPPRDVDELALQLLVPHVLAPERVAAVPFDVGRRVLVRVRRVDRLVHYAPVGTVKIAPHARGVADLLRGCGEHVAWADESGRK